ncbi:MAG: DegT/DnrJ/EryC1/StrS family aminotransferase [Candidatus Eiseniibacteriota bacterium]
MGAMTAKSVSSVPLLDLGAQYAGIKVEMDAAIHRVLASTRFIGGPEVSGLEEEIARYSRCTHAIACASGTDALLLSLKALGIGPGDEVVTSAYSFFASAGVVVNAGATPVFIDIDPATYNLDPHRLEAAITPSTKAVIAVHLYGQCCDLGAVRAVCDKKDVWLIEDAAQAIGAEWEGRRAGSVGDLGCFSFFPSKNLGAAGDGGMVVAQDAALADRVRLLREHGARPKYHHALVGTNSRLDAIQAAILRVKLKHLDRWSEKRALNARLYDQLLEGSRIGRPYRDARARHIFNQYVVRVPNRDAVRTRMTDRGIGTEVYYPVPLHLQACFAMIGHQPGDMPHSEAAAKGTLALPIYPELTEDQIRHVAATLRDVLDAS